MDFGLWVEPEMVNPDSNLYRAHPDWVIHFPGRPRTEGRNQLVLNLARPDVRDFVLNTLDNLLKQNDIAFLKWDYNRNWSEPGWPTADLPDQQEIYVEYVRNLYWILAELRRRHPNVEIESCSGGGGRIDLGIMALTDQVWPSDNTDPLDRMKIQHGFTHAYTPAVMMAWVTDSPHWVNKRVTSIEYRFLSAMQGGLGIGVDLNKWQESDFAAARPFVDSYKRVRPTILHGELFRLNQASEADGRWTTLYVGQNKGEAVLFSLLQGSHEMNPSPAIQLRGLDPRARYRVARIGGAPIGAGNPEVASGAYWMSRGIDVPLRGDFVGAGFTFSRIS